ncbi:MAG: hypothetical protein AAGL10_04225 [Pseudomonadota bacterium]
MKSYTVLITSALSLFSSQLAAQESVAEINPEMKDYNEVDGAVVDGSPSIEVGTPRIAAGVMLGELKVEGSYPKLYVAGLRK